MTWFTQNYIFTCICFLISVPNNIQQCLSTLFLFCFVITNWFRRIKLFFLYFLFNVPYLLFFHNDFLHVKFLFKFVSSVSVTGLHDHIYYFQSYWDMFSDDGYGTSEFIGQVFPKGLKPVVSIRSIVLPPLCDIYVHFWFSFCSSIPSVFR